MTGLMIIIAGKQDCTDWKAQSLGLNFKLRNSVPVDDMVALLSSGHQGLTRSVCWTPTY